MSNPKFCVDRDGDLWERTSVGTWRCVSTASADQTGSDLANVCGPLKLHQPYPDDGALYCGWTGDGASVGGCGEAWPCSTVRRYCYPRS